MKAPILARGVAAACVFSLGAKRPLGERLPLTQA